MGTPDDAGPGADGEEELGRRRVQRDDPLWRRGEPNDDAIIVAHRAGRGCAVGDRRRTLAARSRQRERGSDNGDTEGTT